jgi:ATP-dependent DNA helicase RecQ
MSIDYNSVHETASDSAIGLGAPQGFGIKQNLLSNLVDAASSIPGLTLVSNDNLEVLDHLGSGRDMIVTGPDRLTSLVCTALPAIAGSGLIVVLTNSMQNLRKQLNRLSTLGIYAASFDLAPTKQEKRALWEDMDSGKVQVLALTPGRLASHRFRERLSKRSVSLIIINQAQMMSPWSHKFIPTYRFAGTFISSLLNGTQAPQKIAIAWNPNGRINYDLTKTLGLEKPYNGKLIAEAIPGMAIETKTIATENEKYKLLNRELENCTGQGVIYCNSINQIYETSEILTNRGEDFAVIRPGVNEFQAAQIRNSFEQGLLRIVISLGSFLTDVESTSGLEFVIFNGMPESVEAMGRELLCAEDAGFIKCTVLACEKDYYQHRFLIDKSYPDPLVMRSCVQNVRDVFGSKVSVTPEALAAHVRTVTPFPGEEVEHCLQVLIREGLLERVVDHDTGITYVKFNVSTEAEANFWHEYPLRKIDHVARLDRIRDFVAKDGDRSKQLLSMIR